MHPELADAVGLSQNGLLHYFGSKDALFIEIVRHHNEAVAVQIDFDHADFTHGLVERILREVAASALVAMQERGQFPADADPAATADLIAASFDGLQMLWLYDHSVDVRGRIAYLLTRLGVVDDRDESL